MKATDILLLPFSPAGGATAREAGAAGSISKIFSLIMLNASVACVLLACLSVCLSLYDVSPPLPGPLYVSWASYNVLVLDMILT